MRKINGQAMHEDWDQRARRNAEHYIDTDQKQWTESGFLQAGYKIVNQYIFPFLDNMNYPLHKGTLLEVGVGTGRLLWWTRDFVKDSIGVDVSSVMIDKAKQLLRKHPNKLDHVKLLVNSGEDLSIIAGQSIDFLYCWTVLQHIPDMMIQLHYLGEMCRVLKSGGLFLVQLHADHDEYAKLYPEWKKRQETGDMQKWIDAEHDVDCFETWMCNPISEGLARKVLQENGLEIIREKGQNTGRWIIYGKKK